MFQFIFNKNTITKEIFYFMDGLLDENLKNFQLSDLIKTIKAIVNENILLENCDKFDKIGEIYNYFFNSFNCMTKIIKKKSYNLIDILDKDNQEQFSFFLRNKVYDYLDMKRFDLSNKLFIRLIFKNVDLAESNMKNSDFSYCDFTNANLESCDLSNSNLFCAIFSNTNLCYADLRGANLNNSIIKKEKKYFVNTKINIYQLKYFWPEIIMFYQYLQIYINNNLASKKEIEAEFDRIRGFHLEI